MKNLITKIGAKPITLATASLGIASAAMADTTAGGGSSLDYTTSFEAFSTQMGTFFSTNGPKAIGALVVILAFGIAWKLIKRAAKSV